MQADMITDHVTISACEEGQEWMAAVALLREMQHWQMQASVITSNATISACDEGQQWMAAVALLHLQYAVAGAQG